MRLLECGNQSVCSQPYLIEVEIKMIAIDYQDTVAVVKLSRDVTNALNLELVNALAECLQRVEQDPDINGLVLGSSNDKFLSIGFDIPQLFDLSRGDFESFYRAFNRLCLRLYTLPKPTVAAVTGHAIAGGCILVLCCDYRFIAEGRKLMGLIEIKLGVPVPYLADCLLRSVVGVRNAREMAESGEFYQPAELLQMGLVDGVVPLEQVLPAAIAKARSLGAMPQEAYAIIKHNRVEQVETRVLAHLEDKMQLFLERWYSDATRERLREAVKKF